MKKLLLIILGLGVAGMLAASSAAAQAPTRDSVTGRLTADVPGVGGSITWTINASSGPSGESPTGTFESSGFLNASFPLTCLQVTGNRAVIGGRLTVGGFVVQVYLVVVDEPGDAQDGILYQFFINDPATPATCAAFAAGGGTPPPARLGSVVVTDAQPIPTSKDQCKNGGWRDFPGFKNEGDCVSFVATGGKNPPGTSP